MYTVQVSLRSSTSMTRLKVIKSDDDNDADALRRRMNFIGNFHTN